MLKVSSPIYTLLPEKLTIEGVVESPISFGIISILLSLNTAIQEKVVPKSIPIATFPFSFVYFYYIVIYFIWFTKRLLLII